jgi:hypothetical protein
METGCSEMIANSSREFENYLFEILKSPIDSKALQAASHEDFYLELSNILVAMPQYAAWWIIMSALPFLTP